ncbi:hypothetical protein EV715DRAFT_298192 [Schizophyllum commune]
MPASYAPSVHSPPYVVATHATCLSVACQMRTTTALPPHPLPLPSARTLLSTPPGADLLGEAATPATAPLPSPLLQRPGEVTIYPTTCPTPFSTPSRCKVWMRVFRAPAAAKISRAAGFFNIYIRIHVV